MNQAVTTRDAHARATVRTPARSLCLPGRDLTLTELMRVLDGLRRELARSTRGHEGAFAGYDVLNLSGWEDGDEERSIRLTARLVSDEDTRQTVEYSAAPCDHADGRCHPLEGDQYLRARGTTVALAAPQVRPAWSLGSWEIASPYR